MPGYTPELNRPERELTSNELETQERIKVDVRDTITPQKRGVITPVAAAILAAVIAGCGGQKEIERPTETQSTKPLIETKKDTKKTSEDVIQEKIMVLKQQIDDKVIEWVKAGNDKKAQKEAIEGKEIEGEEREKGMIDLSNELERISGGSTPKKPKEIIVNYLKVKEEAEKIVKDKERMAKEKEDREKAQKLREDYAKVREIAGALTPIKNKLEKEQASEASRMEKVEAMEKEIKNFKLQTNEDSLKTTSAQLGHADVMRRIKDKESRMVIEILVKKYPKVVKEGIDKNEGVFPIKTIRDILQKNTDKAIEDLTDEYIRRLAKTEKKPEEQVKEERIKAIKKNLVDDLAPIDKYAKEFFESNKDYAENLGFNIPGSKVEKNKDGTHLFVHGSASLTIDSKNIDQFVLESRVAILRREMMMRIYKDAKAKGVRLKSSLEEIETMLNDQLAVELIKKYGGKVEGKRPLSEQLTDVKKLEKYISDMEKSYQGKKTIDSKTLDEAKILIWPAL